MPLPREIRFDAAAISIGFDDAGTFRFGALGQCLEISGDGRQIYFEYTAGFCLGRPVAHHTSSQSIIFNNKPPPPLD